MEGDSLIKAMVIGWAISALKFLLFSLWEFFAMCKVGKGTLGFFAYKLDRRQGKVHSSVFHFECRKGTLKIFTVKKLVVRKLSKSRLQKGLGCFIRVVFSQLSLPDSRK